MSKNKFYSFNNHPEGDFSSPSGEFVYSHFVERVVDGVHQLVVDGREHHYEDIQKARAGTDFKKTFDIASRTGDLSMLNMRRTLGFYDVSELPKDALELRASVDRAADSFYELPAQIRSLFGNSVDKFKSSIYDGSFDSVMASAGIAPRRAEPLTTNTADPIASSDPPVSGSVSE